jgi:hypothetical protein
MMTVAPVGLGIVQLFWFDQQQFVVKAPESETGARSNLQLD